MRLAALRVEGMETGGGVNASAGKVRLESEPSTSSFMCSLHSPSSGSTARVPGGAVPVDEEDTVDRTLTLDEASLITSTRPLRRLPSKFNPLDIGGSDIRGWRRVSIAAGKCWCR